ncbi:MAG: hypothetical protein ACPL68_05865 [Candidatus Hydrothermia bacterium]
MPGILIRETGGRKSMREFVMLPDRLPHRDQWVPPIYSDDMAFFDPRKNLAFRYCDVRLLLAYRGGRPVGRIAGIIINHRVNSFRNENLAGFGFLKTGDDPEVTKALLPAIESRAGAEVAVDLTR